MGKYISLEEAEKFISENKHRFGITVANSCNFREMLRMMKTSDVSEIVHGKVTHVSEDAPYCEYGTCSKCGAYIPAWNYCPNCGAKMDLTGADA